MSAFMYSLQNLDVKFSSRYYDTWTIIFFRGIIGLILSWIYVFMVRVRSKQIIKLCIRGLLGALTIVTSFFALGLLDMTLAVILTSTASLWTGLFSYMRRQGNWHIKDTVGALLCISGIGLITWQKYDHDTLHPHFVVGSCMALSSAIFQGMVNVTIYDIKDENTVIITMYSMLMSALFSGIGMAYNRHPIPLSMPMIEMSLCGIISFAAQYLKTRSLQESKNIHIILLRYFDIVFALVWDILLFHIRITVGEIGGFILIVSGSVIPIIVSHLRE